MSGKIVSDVTLGDSDVASSFVESKNACLYSEASLESSLGLMAASLAAASDARSDSGNSG